MNLTIILQIIIMVIFLSQITFFKEIKFFINNLKKRNIYNILEEINKWINKCQNESLNFDFTNSREKAKITALITLFNSQNSISTAVKSIQNQLFYDIEILVVEDCSTDNSQTIIQNMQKKDKRIKIIKNKKNRGALYSKSIGILKSTGNYIMILDSDDLFANQN